MVKKTIKSIFNAMTTIGTFKQKDYSNKNVVVELPYLSHSEAKDIVKTYQSKVAEIVEFKKFNEENLSKHNGNYIVKVYEGSDRLSFELICKDKPFDNRSPKVEKKVKVVEKKTELETISFELFSKAVGMSENVKIAFGKTVGKNKFTLEDWQKKYTDWLEKSKPVEKKVSFTTFVNTTKKEKNWVERFKSENSIDGLHTISEWDDIFINWVPQNITFSEFARAKNLPKENVVLYNKDDNSDGLILPVEKWEKKYNRWLEFRKTTTEKKTEETVFDGKVVYKNVEYLLNKQGKNFQDLKNCLPVNLVAKIIKSKTMQMITPEDAARLVTYLNTDVNFFLNRNSKVQYEDVVSTIENIQKEIEEVATDEKTNMLEVKTTKDNLEKHILSTPVEPTPKKSVKEEKSIDMNPIATIEKQILVEPKKESTVKILNEEETKEVLAEENEKFENRNKELVKKLLDCFDLNANINLNEDFNFKQLFAYMCDEKKDNDKIQSRDFIMSNVFIDTANCAMDGMSMDFVRNLKTIVDELYENQKTIESYNV